MTKKILTFAIIQILLSFSFLYAQKETNLQNLIDEAIIVSPKIKQQYSRFLAAKSNIEVGTNLPDPTLTLGLLNLPTNSFSFSQEPMTGKIIGLSQGLPFPGALSSASDVKAVDTLIIQQEIADLKNQIKKDVSNLYYELGLVRKKHQIALESKLLLQQISEVAKSNYEVAKSSLHNIIQVEVQITRVIDKIEEYSGTEEALLAELNAILLRDADIEISTNSISPIEKYEFSIGNLISLSKEFRPFLKGIQHAEEKTRLMEKQAEYAYYPNFKLGLQYTQRDHIASTGINLNNFLSVVVGLTIPINYGGKKSEKINQAKFLQLLNRDKYNSSLQSLHQNFGRISAKIKELKVRENLIVKSLLPQAKQALKAALADYQVAKIDFANIMKSENDILKIKTDLVTIRTKYQMNINQLEFLTGYKKLKENNL